MCRPFGTLLILQHVILNLNFRSYTTTGNVWSSDYCPTGELQVGQTRVDFSLDHLVLLVITRIIQVYYSFPSPGKMIQTLGLSEEYGCVLEKVVR